MQRRKATIREDSRRSAGLDPGESCWPNWPEIDIDNEDDNDSGNDNDGEKDNDSVDSNDAENNKDGEEGNDTEADI